MIKTCCVNTKSVTQFGRLRIKQYNTYSMQGKKSQYLRLFGIFVRMPVCVCTCVRACMYISVCICVCICVIVVTLVCKVENSGFAPPTWRY